ncbi:MAG: ABC transporter ATP-binding protein [Chloroflexota bacterium]
MIRFVVQPWRALIAVIVVCFLLATALDVAPALLVQKIVDEHLTTGVRDGLLWLGVVYFGSIVAMRWVNGLGIYLVAVVAQGALHDLRVRLFTHLQAVPMSYYDQTPLGDIISRGTADVETVDTLFSSGGAILVSSVLSLLTTAIAMLVLSVPLSIVTAFVVPLLVAITQFFRVRVRDAERANRIATGLMNTHLQETLSGVEVIRSFRRVALFVTRFRGALQQVVAAFNRSTMYNSFYPPLMATLSAISVALLLWLGASGVAVTWGITIGTLTAFVLLFRRFFNVIIDLGDEWQTVQSALSGLERIAQVLAVPSEDGKREAWSVERERYSSDAPRSTHDAAIALQAVTFGYLAERPVLRGVSLCVRAGEHIALVGRTGAGKTSALHLLAGLYAPWAGAVSVAGCDPRAMAADERRRVIGIVPQTVQLFSGTVRDNLTLGDATVPRDDIERAAIITGADEFIRALPQGYDTPLSGAGRGGGAQLSAGQRQLLALTRALVWNPKVLLLDEATAAVDNASDTAFRAALRADVASQQRAVLTVAHRLSTAREADRVLVMDAGRIVEEGTPDELIARGGRFAALVELEAAGWDWQNA